MKEISKWIEDSGYSSFLGAELLDVDGESAKLRLPWNTANSNPGDVLHGGCAVSLGILGGQAVARAALGPQAAGFHTAQLQVSYLAAAQKEEVIAQAHLLRRGKTLCFVRTDVTTQSGKPIAAILTTVRGRFGKNPAPPPSHGGDHGESDPGEIGGFIEQQPFIANRKLRIEHMSGGTSRIAMPFANQHNGDCEGAVHEGAIAALLDTCGAMASWAESGIGPYRASTVSLQSEAFAPAPAEDLVAYGRCTHRDGDIFWADVDITAASTATVVGRGTVLYRIVTN